MARKTLARISVGLNNSFQDEPKEIESVFTFPSILERKDLALYFKMFKSKYFL